MTIEEKSYLYGLFGADGTLSLSSRNRGELYIELNERDADIIYQIHNILPNGTIHRRSRLTNFGNMEAISYTNHQMWVRQEFINFGFPVGKKSETIDVPNSEYDEFAFWRGFLDGDGSCGLTSKNRPFLSLVTASESIKDAYLIFLNKYFQITKRINRCKRDNVYNIMICDEAALAVCERLYAHATIYIQRKYDTYLMMKMWKRQVPKAPLRKSWDEEQDSFILTHSTKESANYLCRTTSSIKNRKFRLTHLTE